MSVGPRMAFTGIGTSMPPSEHAVGGTITVTILAGPLNYVGVNPKVACKLPEPSR